MKKYVCDLVTTIEEIQPQPLHLQLNTVWWNATHQEWIAACDADQMTDTVQKDGTKLLTHYQDAYAALLTHIQRVPNFHSDLKTVQELLNKPQSVQREGMWYEEMKAYLRASEFYKLLGSPYAYGELILSKLPSLEHPTRQNCCHTAFMTPCDWGIRFEPLSKLFLEREWGATLADVGRLRHTRIPQLAASPDGILSACTTQPDKIGSLVEIKCPISRAIGKSVPPNYWYQMQIQMEVANIDLCYYCEFIFRSATAKSSELEIPANCCAKGVLNILQNNTTSELKYVYGPFEDMNWSATEDGWTLAERVPWYLEKFWIQPVVRDCAWFAYIEPQITRFWEDVESAKKGDYVFPTKRERKCNVVTPICDIVDDDA